MELSDRYNPKDVEEKTYLWWENNGYFSSEDVSTKPPFSIILPPPNVTGALHLGHALDHTIQDVLIRWKRMSGFNTMWLPGTDHAGIATQSVVERELKKEGKTRKELGREEFVKRVWQWKEQYGGRIVSQMKRLGDSCDWKREVFTLDEGVSKAVRKVFVNLYEKNLIYKGTRLINWSPALESAISDLEVEYKEIKGSLYHIRYDFEDGSGHVIIATTRPETLLADSAVAVHPEDERYEKFLGKKLVLPILGRKIPLITDAHVDKEFGTGALKVTPAHDFNDYEIGKRHSLEMVNILNKDGTLNENAGPFAGLKTQEARKQIVTELEQSGLLIKIEPHVHQVGHCSRTGCVAEPFLSEQWFVKTAPLAETAKRVVESGTIVFEPESWTKTYLHWMSIIQDWCISRQLWWGHRIPAWYCEDCQQVIVAEKDPTECTKCKSKKLKQDDDVLDTWFSSGLWPFSTMGWPEETETLKTFYPTNVLVTGHDIIFFWVARMIMSGLEFKKDVPFRTVYIHGLVRDAQGKKMSKSSGNSEDPLEIIEEMGADALRFTLMAQIASGRDLKFSKQRLEGYRNFMNKIWNAARFSLAALENFEAPQDAENAVPNKANLSDADQWIVHKLGICEKTVDEALQSYRFSDAANAVYTFIWHEFCDWYLEFIKPVIYGAEGEEKTATQLVLAQVLNRSMRLLHPFAPFITEEIYQKLPIKKEACVIDSYPTIKGDKKWLEMGSETVAQELDVVREVITAIRNIRGENRIKPGVSIQARLAPADDRVQKVLGNNRSFIQTLAKVGELKISADGDLSKCAVTPVRAGDMSVDVIVPLEGLVDFDEEIKRLTKTIEKLSKDIASLSGRLNNESFVKNAPEEVVEEGKANLKEMQGQLKALEESKSRLS
ncbi:MAG: valine--tRNA ligase [Bdellovibrionales bacterium]|nr:valine--tRNA ligase [Bdellovibrionales bacterium]